MVELPENYLRKYPQVMMTASMWKVVGHALRRGTHGCDHMQSKVVRV